jgi:hypothetical protein
LVKVFRGFRFDPDLYARFKELAGRSGLMVTEAFEKFMTACVEARAVRFPVAQEKGGGVEPEARVLLAWLRKGRVSYSATSGDEEISIDARLLQLLSQVEDATLRKEIEDELKTI